MINTLPQSLIEAVKNIIDETPHVDVDGIKKHRYNSDGKLIHPTETGIKNFHRWFGDSKTVDSTGRPQVYYHGTTKDFDKFSPKKSFTGLNTSFFTPDKDFAGSYDYTHNAGHVMPVYIKAKNIFDLSNPDHHNKLKTALENKTYYSSFQGKDLPMSSLFPKNQDYFHMEHPLLLNEIKNMKFDGVVVHERGVRNIGIFNGKNVKSAIGNKGDFISNKITEETNNEVTDNHYNFNEWKQSAKDKKLKIINMGRMVGTHEKVDVYHANSDDGSSGGQFFKGGSWNYGHITYQK